MDHESCKTVVKRFNQEIIVEGRRDAFDALMAPDFINHSAPPGAANGPESMWNTFQQLLRPALADLRVTLHEQLCDGDKVTTRKTISGTHTGSLMGIAPTGQRVSIDVIDIVQVRDGRYVAHWGLNTLPSVLANLRSQPAA